MTPAVKRVVAGLVRPPHTEEVRAHANGGIPLRHPLLPHRARFDLLDHHHGTLKWSFASAANQLVKKSSNTRGGTDSAAKREANDQEQVLG